MEELVQQLQNSNNTAVESLGKLQEAVDKEIAAGCCVEECNLNNVEMYPCWRLERSILLRKGCTSFHLNSLMYAFYMAVTNEDGSEATSHDFSIVYRHSIQDGFPSQRNQCFFLDPTKICYCRQKAYTAKRLNVQCTGGITLHPHDMVHCTFARPLASNLRLHIFHLDFKYKHYPNVPPMEDVFDAMPRTCNGDVYFEEGKFE